MKKWSIYIVILLVLSFALYYIFTKKDIVTFTNSQNSKTKISVEIADTLEERQQGLSGVEKLDENRGMLFIFPENSKSAFWMKDMKIPLDIIFIDSDLKIVDMKIDQKPCVNIDVCELINSSQSYRYVVEVNSGFVNTKGLKIGDSVKIVR